MKEDYEQKLKLERATNLKLNHALHHFENQNHNKRLDELSAKDKEIEALKTDLTLANSKLREQVSLLAQAKRDFQETPISLRRALAQANERLYTQNMSLAQARDEISYLKKCVHSEDYESSHSNDNSNSGYDKYYE